MHIIHMEGEPFVYCDIGRHLVPFREEQYGVHECEPRRFGTFAPPGLRAGMMERERMLALAQARAED